MLKTLNTSYYILLWALFIYKFILKFQLVEQYTLINTPQKCRQKDIYLILNISHEYSYQMVLKYLRYLQYLIEIWLIFLCTILKIVYRVAQNKFIAFFWKINSNIVFFLKYFSKTIFLYTDRYIFIIIFYLVYLGSFVRVFWMHKNLLCHKYQKCFMIYTRRIRFFILGPFYFFYYKNVERK